MNERLHIPRLLTSLFSVLFVGLLLLPGAAWAQQQDESTEGHDAAQKSQHTPSTTFKNDSDATILQTNDDGGLLAPGEEGTGAIPAEGEGTRMMWYPAKAAFRAGRVGEISQNADYWNAGNVGIGSVAIGIDTKASGKSATAMGEVTTASKRGATAMGAFTEASGVGATAFGASVDATGNRATAFGFETEASAANATAMGFRSAANGEATTAMGSETDADGDYSTAMGKKTLARGIRATALGSETKAWEKATTAMGQNTTAKAEAATAIGSNTEASGVNATAMGFDTEASGEVATAMGNNTKASAKFATAMGNATQASGLSATTMGFSTIASGESAVAAGENTRAATSRSVSIGECNGSNNSSDGTLFVVGNGVAGLIGCNSNSDAFKVNDQGEAFADAHETFSDRRLKTGIEPLGESTLEELTEIRPVRFRFKKETTHPSGEQIGLIAQDVRKEFPSLVSKGSEGYLSLAYPKLTAVLLKGLQEQQHRIDSLQDRVQQVETLRKRVARLEAGSGGSSVLASVPGSGLLVGLLIGGLLGAGLLWRIREGIRDTSSVRSRRRR